MAKTKSLAITRGIHSSRKVTAPPLMVDPNSLGNGHGQPKPATPTVPSNSLANLAHAANAVNVHYSVGTVGAVDVSMGETNPEPLVVLADFAGSSSLSTAMMHTTPPNITRPMPSTIRVITPLAEQHGHQPLLRQQEAAPYDMSMTGITMINMRSIIKGCVKTNIFRKCKFYHRDVHGVFSTNPHSMCGQVMQYCNINASSTAWWHDIRQLVVQTHTNHRNNCIKAMQQRFTCKFVYPLFPQTI